jgi:hypothetical protein
LTEALAILLWLIGAGGMAVGLVLWARSGFFSPGFVFFHGPVPMIAYGLAVLTQATSGFILALRRPGNIQGWLTLVFGINGAVGGVIFGYLSWARAQGYPEDTQVWLAWLMNWLVLPLGTLISVSIGFIFPDGKLLSPKWRIGIAIAAFGAIGTAAVLALSPGPLVLFPSVINPLTGPGAGLGPLLLVSLAVFVSAAPLTGFALLRRYSMAWHIGRLQIRWFVTLSLGLEIMFVAFLASLIFLPSDAPLGEIILTGLFLSAALPAIALLFAILRYRLYDIDTIISRTFVYGALTAILGALYGASATIFQRIFTTVTGETSDAALILTTLVLTTSFNPVKNRLEQFFAERFRQAPPPSEAALALLDEPAFVAALDARISGAMARASRAGGAARASRTRRAAAQDQA